MARAAVALLQASGIEGRWSKRRRFAVLMTGSAVLEHFVAAWRAWRGDPQRCERLDVIVVAAAAITSIELPPDADAEARALASRLAAQLPPPTRNLHRIGFDDGRVQLLICPSEPALGLRRLVAQVDAFVIDAGVDLLAREPRLAKSIARLAAPDATLALARPTAVGLGALEAAGFRIETGADRTEPAIVVASYQPRFAPRRAGASRGRSASLDRRAVIIGGGLAGCATAWALAEHGWHSMLIERGTAIADEASGNPAGLFHGIVNGHDGAHARFYRAAALEAHAAAAIAIRAHGVRGALDGLLQSVDEDPSTLAMQALLRRLDLPPAYVQALTPAAASARAGLSLDRPAWFYPGAGWIAPRGLARSFVERAGARVEVRTGVSVGALRRAGDRWELLDADGRCVESADTVVLANAGDAFRLIGGLWPVEPARGQISLRAAGASSVPRLPHVPITGAGYLLPEIDGCAVFGATSDPGDDRDDIRNDDHRRNWSQLARLVPSCGAAALDCPANLEGRAAVRWVSRDRLPLIGGVPLTTGVGGGSDEGRAARLDQPRFVPRQPGLFMFAALGARGITTAALGAQLLAASIAGGPSPVEADLLDAVDPARFAVRDRRRPRPRA